MNSINRVRLRNSRSCNGFTLTEVVISLGISIVAIASIFTAYITNAKISDKALYSSAANAQLLLRMEQVRGARWDLRASTPIDELIQANLTTNVWKLNVPYTSTNVIYATNITTITNLTSTLRIITTQCLWRDPTGVAKSNSVVCYRSPTI